MKYILIALTVLLTGCATISDAVVTEKVIHVDPRYFEPCKPLNELTSNSEFSDVLANIIDNTSIYAECRNKQADSIILLKKLTNN